jgi:hypothetical protein
VLVLDVYDYNLHRIEINIPALVVADAMRLSVERIYIRVL